VIIIRNEEGRPKGGGWVRKQVGPPSFRAEDVLGVRGEKKWGWINRNTNETGRGGEIHVPWQKVEVARV